MTESPRNMLGHVALRLRLVYEAAVAYEGVVDFKPPVDSPAATTASTDVPGWKLVGLLPEHPPEDRVDQADPEADPPSVRQRRFATEPIVLTLDRDEAQGYYLNLTSPQPSLFALLRLPDVASSTAAHAPPGLPEAEAITASYSEAARWMDGGMVVIRTPLPEPMLAWIAEFAQYHFPTEGSKKRGKYRPSFLSRQEFGDVARAELHEAGPGPAVSPTDTRH